MAWHNRSHWLGLMQVEAVFEKPDSYLGGGLCYLDACKVSRNGKRIGMRLDPLKPPRANEAYHLASLHDEPEDAI